MLITHCASEAQTWRYMLWYYARVLELPYPVLRALAYLGSPVVEVRRQDRVHLEHYGERHCNWGPAERWDDGSLLWYSHGQLHRQGAPACQWGNGAVAWYREGIFLYSAEPSERK